MSANLVPCAPTTRPAAVLTVLPGWRKATATAPAIAAEATALRRFSAAQLTDWRVPGDDHEAAVLIVGELLANAVQHGRSLMTLSLDLRPRLLRISVADHGAPCAPHHGSKGLGTSDSMSPTNVPPADSDEHGRGLAIVSALATRVGVVHGESSCRVAAVVRLSTWALPTQAAPGTSGGGGR